jgi:hypothetical protein
MQGWQFPTKNYAAEDGVDGTIGLFRRNSGCSCEKFEAKISEKKRKKRSEILNSETHVKRIQIRFISLISETFF